MGIPGGQNSLDVVLKFLMDNEDLKKGAQESVKSVEKLDKEINDLTKSVETQTKRIEDWKDESADLKKQQDAIDKYSDKFGELDREIKGTNETIRVQEKQLKENKKRLDELLAPAKEREEQEKRNLELMQREADVLGKIATTRSTELNNLKARADLLERGSTTLFAAGVGGFTAITALAKNYIDNTEESNEITKQWAENSAKVAGAQARIGKVAAETLLPLFTRLAEITDKAAAYIEKNPEILQKGLKTAEVVATIGMLGLAVSKGIKLYADIQMIAVGNMQLVAAKLMQDAATKQLAAATGGKVTGALGKAVQGGGTAAAGGSVVTGEGAAVGGAAAGGAASIGVVIASVLAAVAAGGVVGLVVNDILAKSGVKGFIRSNTFATGAAYEVGRDLGRLTGKSDQEVERKALVFSAIIGKLTGAIDQSSPLWIRATESVSAHNAAVSSGIESVGALTESQNSYNKNVQETIGKNAQLAGSMMTTGRAADVASAGVSRFPNVLIGVANSIGSFISRVIGSFSGAGATSTAPIHDYTGFAYTGLYRMAQDGQRQFVLSGSATRRLESVLGAGRLNESNILNTFNNSVINNNRSNVFRPLQLATENARANSGMTYIDNSNFAPGVNAADVHKIRQQTRQDLREILK